MLEHELGAGEPSSRKGCLSTSQRWSETFVGVGTVTLVVAIRVYVIPRPMKT
jgi:hypothetical protein